MDTKTRRKIARSLLKAADTLDAAAGHPRSRSMGYQDEPLDTRTAEEKRKADLKYPKQIEKIRKLIDDNYHTEALMEAAKLAKNKKAEKALEGLTMLHDFFQSMTPEMLKIRETLRQQVKRSVGRLPDYDAEEILSLI